MSQSLSSPLELSPEPTLQGLIPSSQSVALDVTGMKCAGCVRVVEQALGNCPGVLSATVNLATEVATVHYQPETITPIDLANTLTEAGFPSQPRFLSGKADHPGLVDVQAQRQLETQRQLWRLAIATLLLILSAIGHLDQLTGLSLPGFDNIWLHAGLATVALLGPGRAMLIDGWQGWRRNAPNMNTLVGLGTLTAYITSLIALFFPQLDWECFFDEPVMLVGFILLGRTLEQQARNRAATAFQALLALRPTTARLIPSTAMQDSWSANQATEASGSSSDFPASPQWSAIEIPADSVRVGEWLQVLPGDHVPVDGEIVAGQTTVNESMLTGESLPVLKQVGDRVTAGSLNQSGAIALRATRTGQETTLAQIIALVETAQTRKAPIQKLADTVAGYFTYGVMAIAALTFFFWYFIGSHLWIDRINPPQATLGMESGHALGHHLLTHALGTSSPLLLSLKLAIAVLVVACPCALGLATPTAILVGSGIGAERGLLIRGSDVLERVHTLDTILLDKTGTLTTGQPTVTDCIPHSSISASTLLQLAATVESGTQHPLAIAIQQQAQQQGLPILLAQEFTTVPGKGVAARVQQFSSDSPAPFSLVMLGTEVWLAENHVEIGQEWQTPAQDLARAGKTIVYVVKDGTVVGLIAVSDTLRPDAIDTVAQLQQLGLTVKLLTGDRPETSAAVARSLGLSPEQVLAGVGPDTKADLIAQLQNQGHRVAMVGDGINDAPALAQADVGIAIHSGTDVARETADIILMRDRLTDVVESIRLSQATFHKIQQNLFWAFAYNILGIPLAAGLLLPSLGFLLSPAAAGALMAFSSVSVVLNSLLLYLTFRQPTPQKSVVSLPAV